VNIVLLSTGRPMRVNQVAEARHQLRIDSSAHLALVSWNRPAQVLPVDQHVLVRTVGGSHSLPVHDVEPAVEPAELEDDGSSGLALGAGGPEEESADTFAQEASDVQVPSRSTAAKFTPSSVAHALRWRTNRARLAMRRHPALSRVVGPGGLRRHPTVARVLGSTKLRRAGKAVVPDSLASRYAAACLVSRDVNELFAQADVVVAMDAHTHRAAWLLARRHPGPDVVVGLAAAQRSLQARQEQKVDALS
jgi:hypothetical protein